MSTFIVPPLRHLTNETEVPGLILIAEIGRRLAKVVRAAQDSDPFTSHTARALATLGNLLSLQS